MIITALVIYIILISVFAYLIDKRGDVYRDRFGVWRYVKSFKEGQTVEIPIEALHNIQRSAYAFSQAVRVSSVTFKQATTAFREFNKAQMSVKNLTNKGD